MVTALEVRTNSSTAPKNPAESSPRPQSLKKNGLMYEEWSVSLPKFATLGMSQRGTKEEVFGEISNTFTNPSAQEFEVRDVGYLNGTKKSKTATKRPSPDAAYSVVGVNVFKSKKSMDHIASKVQSLKKHIEENSKNAIVVDGVSIPEFLVVTFSFKTAFRSDYTSVVQVFQRHHAFEGKTEEDMAFKRAFLRFLAADEKTKGHKLKFTFKIRDAPGALRKTVGALGGERPVLIGKALKTTFHEGPNYLEINQDVSSSMVASMLNGAILKAAKTICIDTAWTVEAQEEDELPERLLGVNRWHYVNPADAYVFLDKDFEPIAE